MSRLPFARALLGAATGAACIAAALPSPASAAITKTHGLQCNFPTVGDVTVGAQWTLDPPQYQTGVKSPDFPIAVGLTFGDAASSSLAGIDGLTRLQVKDAVGDVPTSSTAGEGPSPKLALGPVPADISVPGNTEVALAASYPGFFWRQPAMAGILVGSVALNLTAYDAAGEPIRLPQGLGLSEFGTYGPLAATDANPDTFDVACSLDFSGEFDGLLAEVEIVGDPIEPTPPTVPTGLTAVAADTSVTLSWAPSTDADGTIRDYQVIVDGSTRTVSGGATSVVISDLEPGTAHEFRVVAEDDEYLTSDVSAPLTVTTTGGGPTVQDFAYDLKGSTTLRTLTKGTLPLTGAIDGDLDVAADTFEADLALADTSGRLLAAGILPVTAKIGFAPEGKTTGTFAGGVLTTSSKVRIKVKDVSFGGIRLADGSSCQTKELSDVTLKSSGAFSLGGGGKLAGTYAISNLTGCGALGSVLSPLTAGKGNTIALTLTPKA